MAGYEKLKRKFAESHVGDENIDVDYDTLYGTLNDDGDESFEDEGRESFSDVKSSGKRESAFDVDESAFTEEAPEDFDPEDLLGYEAGESEVDYDVEDSESIGEDFDDFDEDDERGQERSKTSPSAFARRMSSSASDVFGRLKEGSKKHLQKDEEEESGGGFEDSAFDVSEKENDSIISKVAANTKKSKKDRVKAANDILEILGISETFTIDEQYYLPADLKEIRFSYQRPEGYSPREVDKFHKSVSRTIQHYVDLLQQRNTDIVTLATEVDKKDEVINKLQYDQEVAEGINIMPTQGDQKLENELMEAKMTISQLRSDVEEAQARADGADKKVKDAVGLSQEERDKYNELQDDYAKVVRESNEMKKEISNLQTKVLLLQEEAEPDPSESFVFDDYSVDGGSTGNKAVNDQSGDTRSLPNL